MVLFMSLLKVLLSASLCLICLFISTNVKAQEDSYPDVSVAVGPDIIGDAFSPGETIPSVLGIGNNGNAPTTEGATIIVRVTNGTIPEIPSSSIGTFTRIDSSSFQLVLNPLAPGQNRFIDFDVVAGNMEGVEALVVTVTGEDPNDRNPANDESQYARNVEVGATSSSISGTKWRDINGNGERDEGEPGLPGWLIFLDLNNDGLFNDEGDEDGPDQAEPFVITSEDGTYEFANLVSGSYKVREEIAPENPDTMNPWIQTFPLFPIDFHDVTLGINEDETGIDFGNVTASASISGFVWQDNNRNGTQDGEEPTFSFPTVVLGGSLPTGLSPLGREEDFGDSENGDRELPLDGTGFFTFDNLPPGIYEVHLNISDEDSANGWVSTFPIENDGVYEFTLIEGESIDNALLGVLRERIVRVTVTEGITGLFNGSRQLEGVEVRIEDTINGGEVLQQTMTMDQRYRLNTFALFEELTPSVYNVTITLPEGLMLVSPGADQSFTCVADVSGNAPRRFREEEVDNQAADENGPIPRVAPDAECLFQLIRPDAVTRTNSISSLSTTLGNIQSGQDTRTRIILFNASGETTEFTIDAPLPPIPDGVAILAGLDLPGVGLQKQVNGIIEEDPAVIFDGSSCPEPCDGLRLSNANSLVQGIAIRNFPGYGIVIEGDSNAVVQTEVSGNQLGGIHIVDGDNNIIGDTTATTGNRIYNNGGAGILVESGTGNTIRGNAIFSNEGLGIDLGNDGVTANDDEDGDEGANSLLNFPTLTSVTSGSTTIEGVFSGSANTTVALDFYGNSSCDESGNGQGELFLGSTLITTDAQGAAAFMVAFDQTVGIVSATATDSEGNTSEFSICAEISDAFVLDRLAIEPDSISIGTGETFDFNARGFDLFNRAINIDADWMATGGVVDDEGSYTAGSETGSFMITATDPTTQVQAQAIVEVVLAVSTDDEPSGIPREYSLQQNYPNPFNPSTIIAFDIPQTSNVRLAVYDVLGREVTVLASGQFTAGRHSITFNASNLASGIYLYQLQAGSFVQTRKLLLVK